MNYHLARPPKNKRYLFTNWQEVSFRSIQQRLDHFFHNRRKWRTTAYIAGGFIFYTFFFIPSLIRQKKKQSTRHRVKLAKLLLHIHAVLHSLAFAELIEGWKLIEPSINSGL